MNGNLVLIENAVVEEAVFYNSYSGYIIISQNGVTQRLNISRNTSVINESGQCLNLSNIREGSLIDAVASSAMTRSIPPQSAAYLIMVKEKRPETVRRISYVDAANYFLYTGSGSDTEIFVVTPSTLIYNASGMIIPFEDLRIGQLVSIVHADFQTPSIPPRTTAYEIRVIG